VTAEKSVKPQAVGVALVLILAVSLAYYDYQLSQSNSNIQAEVAGLQAAISRLQGSLNQTEVQQGLDSAQVAGLQAALRAANAELASLVSGIRGVQAGNVSMLAKVASQLQSLNATIQSVQASLNSVPPPIFLRVEGTALATFTERADELRYLRLTVTGPSGGVEASIGSLPFNATIPGNLVEWNVATNGVASDPSHQFWPMVLENSPGGTDAIEFEDAGGLQEVAAVLNGTRYSLPVSWNTNVVHEFEIIVVKPGAQVDFLIDDAIVATMTSGIPQVSFLLEAAELKTYGSPAAGVAIMDTYGGVLGGT
jgi:hypothetical protein